jgi:lipopolysaccharide transport system ATP-binding protein
MSKTIIAVENLSKLYNLSAIGTGTLSHDLNRWWQKTFYKEDIFLKNAQQNGDSSATSKDFIWSLKDINFQIKEGEIFGIIGKNGAGKSTLLKLLSKITKPTTGKIFLNGRIASLLEVGTGFHPDLTGRENVFLNGAILGMKKAEIVRKFDEIVDFSGIEKFIDTPVKRYSSGMYVRLAFAVAAHLEPEILILDEVLAVGDAEFQAKCLGKMKDVSTNQGRTVLFVSHSIAAIRQLCNKAILLQQGQQKAVGDIDDVISIYHHQQADVNDGGRAKAPTNLPGYFTDWKLEKTNNDNEHTCVTGDTCIFSFGFKALQNLDNVEVCFMIRHNGMLILNASSLSNGGTTILITPGKHRYKFKVTLPLRNARFDVEPYVKSMGIVIDHWTSTTKLTVLDNFSTKAEQGLINPPINFFTEYQIETVFQQ